MSFTGLFAQKTYTLAGLVTDDKDKALEAVNIFVANQTEKGVGTDASGYFELSLPAGKHQISIAYLGFKQKTISVDLQKNKYIVIKLKEEKTNLNEIVITVKETNKRELVKLIGVTKLNMKKIEQIPMLLGERDVLKAVQLLPGVKATSEGSAGFSVHGGSVDQNLVLLDGAPVYHVSHLMGFFSVFTPDIIKNLHLYKNSIPASYGNRLSSILDVKTNTGNMESFHFGGGMGLIASQLYVEGPLQKDKSSFFISGRKSYADLYTPYIDLEGIKDAKINFFDVNAKLDFKLNNHSSLAFSAYKGRDYYKPASDFSMDYGNEIISLSYRNKLNDKLLSTTSAFYSKYDYAISVRDNVDHQDYVFDISLGIDSKNIKQNFDYRLNLKNKFAFGVDAYLHTIKPGRLQNKITGTDNKPVIDRHAAELDFYAQYQTKISKSLQLFAGLRTSVFARLGEETFYKFNEYGEATDTLYAGKNKSVKKFVKWAPHLALNWRFNPSTAVKLSYDKTYQFLHYLINDATTTPTDLWLPSGINLQPQSSDSYSLTFNKAIGKKYFVSLGGYYRDMANITDYRIGTMLSLSNDVEKDLVQGIGKAYGVEFLFKKTQGNFTGSLSYTYSKTMKRYDVINEGNWYPSAVDRPHDLSVLGTYKFNNRLSFSMMWLYYNGRPITYPAGTYQIDVHNILFFSHRNANRLPDYHRMDISLTLKNKPFKIVDGQKVKKKFESYWNFSIYNTYAHDNTFMVKFKYDEETEKINAYQVTLFKIVPSISYHFKF